MSLESILRECSQMATMEWFEMIILTTTYNTSVFTVTTVMFTPAETYKQCTQKLTLCARNKEYCPMLPMSLYCCYNYLDLVAIKP